MSKQRVRLNNEMATELAQLLRPISVDYKPNSLTQKTLPTLSLALGGSQIALTSYFLPGAALQLHIGAAIVTACLPTLGYYTLKGFEMITNQWVKVIEQRGVERRKTIKLQDDLATVQAAKRREHELALEEKHNQRLLLMSRLQEQRNQALLLERKVQEAVRSGVLRNTEPDTAIAQDEQRRWWRSEILSKLYDPRNLEKTRGGNWIGGQPITVAKLGKARVALAEQVGLIYKNGTHPQWSTDLAPDEERALDILEASGMFAITER